MEKIIKFPTGIPNFRNKTKASTIEKITHYSKSSRLFESRNRSPNLPQLTLLLRPWKSRLVRKFDFVE